MKKNFRLILDSWRKYERKCLYLIQDWNSQKITDETFISEIQKSYDEYFVEIQKNLKK